MTKVYPNRLKAGQPILALLKDYGVLAASTIVQLLDDTTSRRNVRKILERLCYHDLVIKKMPSFGSRFMCFYQLNQDPLQAEVIAGIIGCSPKDVNQPGLRYSHLLHEQDCALVHKSLRDKFPDARIVRDWQFARDPEAKILFPKKFLEARVAPDITLCLPPKGRNSKSSFIAVEVERSRKSDLRLTEKLNRYASMSFLDGVLYFSPKDLILKRLRHLYGEDVVKNAYRIKYYGCYFLACGMLPTSVVDMGSVVVSTEDKALSAAKWISYLQQVPSLERGYIKPDEEVPGFHEKPDFRKVLSDEL